MPIRRKETRLEHEKEGEAASDEGGITLVLGLGTSSEPDIPETKGDLEWELVGEKVLDPQVKVELGRDAGLGEGRKDFGEVGRK